MALVAGAGRRCTYTVCTFLLTTYIYRYRVPERVVVVHIPCVLLLTTYYLLPPCVDCPPPCRREHTHVKISPPCTRAPARAFSTLSVGTDSARTRTTTLAGGWSW